MKAESTITQRTLGGLLGALVMVGSLACDDPPPPAAQRGIERAPEAAEPDHEANAGDAGQARARPDSVGDRPVDPADAEWRVPIDNRPEEGETGRVDPLFDAPPEAGGLAESERPKPEDPEAWVGAPEGLEEPPMAPKGGIPVPEGMPEWDPAKAKKPPPDFEPPPPPPLPE